MEGVEWERECNNKKIADGGEICPRGKVVLWLWFHNKYVTMCMFIVLPWTKKAFFNNKTINKKNYEMRFSHSKWLWLLCFMLFSQKTSLYSPLVALLFCPIIPFFELLFIIFHQFFLKIVMFFMKHCYMIFTYVSNNMCVDGFFVCLLYKMTIWCKKLSIFLIFILFKDEIYYYNFSSFIFLNAFFPCFFVTHYVFFSSSFIYKITNYWVMDTVFFLL